MTETLPPRTTSFASDNGAGASPEIVAAVAAANAGQAMPYGADPVSERMKRRLAEVFEREVDVFLVGSGTAANALSLSLLAPPWGAVLCHPDSHIGHDECGAPEFYTGGAKLVPVPGDAAKMDPAELRRLARVKVGDVHAVQPACASVTQATEVGSVYSLDHLREIGAVCRETGLRLHMDGARFANALAALGCPPAEMTWKLGVDVLSFGAVKNGGMSADAVIVFDRSLAAEMGYRRKRGGHLASKMRFLSAQIDAYLADGLWLANARHANAMAKRLETGLSGIAGVEMMGQAAANILFVRLPAAMTAALLAAGFVFYHDRWEPGVARLVTSLATSEADVDAFLAAARAAALHA